MPAFQKLALISCFAILSACVKDSGQNGNIPISFNVFSYLGVVYEVDPAVGGFWLTESSSLSTRSKNNVSIAIIFKDKPKADAVYLVKTARPSNPLDLGEGECSITVISPVDPIVLGSTGRPGDRVKVKIINGKVYAEFSYIQLSYFAGSTVKSTNLTGSFIER
jgi:hypothetical protein